MRLAFTAALLALALPAIAHGWTRPGHMVSAAIAYDELAARNPEALKRLLAIAAHHPDRGPFEVAIGRATGAERDRRVFMELARWPDDVRGGPHDHPTWHYAMRPVTDPRDPPPHAPSSEAAGVAAEAFALNLRVASDPNAPAADRAQALAWIFHLVGDIHQPLHTAQLFSRRFPDGDRGGSRQHVTDPVGGQPITLHWLWDDSVNRDGDGEAAFARAHELTARLPRSAFPELAAATRAADFTAWGAESYALAAPVVYRADLRTGDTPGEADAAAPAYLDVMSRTAETRLTLAGYRLADIAEAIAGR